MRRRQAHKRACSHFLMRLQPPRSSGPPSWKSLQICCHRFCRSILLSVQQQLLLLGILSFLISTDD